MLSFKTQSCKWTRFHGGLLILLALSSWLACGTRAPRTKVDHGLIMPRPALTQDGVFRLRGNGDDHQVYGGNVAFFAKTITAQQVEALSRVSRDMREWNVVRVKDHEAWRQAMARVENLQAHKEQAPAKDAVVNWVDGNLRGLVARGVVNEDVIQRDFAAYCQAKIVELATDPWFLRHRYRERPSPFVACEDYYATAGFFQGDSCAAAPAGADYFHCLWGEGLLKTAFAARYDAGLARLIDAFPEEWRQWLLCEDANNSGSCSLRKSLRFRDAALGMTALSVTTLPRGAHIGDVPLQNLFKDTGTAGEPTPLRLLNSFQNTERSDILLSYLVGERALTRALALVAERYNGSPAEQDVFFHPSLEPIPAVVNHSTEALREERLSLLAPMDPGLVTRAKELAVAHDEAKVLARRVSGEDATSAQAHFLDAVRQAGVLANEQGLGRAFLFSRLLVDRLDTSLLVQVVLGDGVTHFACVQWPEGHQADCPPALLAKREKAETALVMDRASYDPVTGGLLLSWPLENAAANGLGLKERTPQDPSTFSDFMADELQGTRLRLALFPRVLHDGVGMATGESFIERADGTLVGEGAVSYFETTRLDETSR